MIQSGHEQDMCNMLLFGWYTNYQLVTLGAFAPCALAFGPSSCADTFELFPSLRRNYNFARSITPKTSFLTNTVVVSQKQAGPHIWPPYKKPDGLDGTKQRSSDGRRRRHTTTHSSFLTSHTSR